MRNPAAVLTLLCATALHAQPSCPTSPVDPGGMLLEKSCEPCLAGQPLTFTLVPNTCPYPSWCPTPYNVQPCDRVVWNFGDNSGETTVIGSPSVTHTYAARSSYQVSVTVTNSLSPASTPTTFELLVGSNPPTTLFIDAPPTVSEASPALVVNLTRSGNLDVPTAARYEIRPDGGFTPRINGTEGQVTFAPGESQKTLSFPIVNNDTAYTGPAHYRLEVESSDGTLLAGLQPSYSLFERAGIIITIDDERQPHFRSDDVVIREGTSSAPTFARFTGTLDAPLGRHYHVWASLGGDYSDILANQAGPPGFDFAPGQMTATTDIAIYADAEPEPDETLVLTLPGPYSVDPNGPLYERPSVTMTIVNDDIGFGQYELRTTVGETTTFPIDIGNPLAAGETLTVTAADPKVVSVTASVPVGASKGEVKLTGLLGAHTKIVAELMRPAGPARGEVIVSVFQPSIILVASPETVRLRAGEEATLRVSLSPAQGEPTQIIVQSSSTGIVAVASTLVTAPAGGDAVVTLRGVAPGKATLDIFSLGQPHPIVVPVEVMPNPGRHRAARP